jgi:hypothetical protein
MFCVGVEDRMLKVAQFTRPLEATPDEQHNILIIIMAGKRTVAWVGPILTKSFQGKLKLRTALIPDFGPESLLFLGGPMILCRV